MEKKIIVFSILLCISFLFIGCNSNSSDIPELDTSKTTIVTGDILSIYEKLIEVHESIYFEKDNAEDEELIKVYNLKEGDFKNGVFQRQTGQTFMLTVGEKCDFILLEDNNETYYTDYKEFISSVYNEKDGDYRQSIFKFYIDKESRYVIRIKEICSK